MTKDSPSATGPVLHVTGLTKSYRAAGEEVAVLRGVNLTVAAGESVALTGESGSGKSTLLHLIAGLDAADGGEIRLADAEVSELSDADRAEIGGDGDAAAAGADSRVVCSAASRRARSSIMKVDVSHALWMPMYTSNSDDAAIVNDASVVARNSRNPASSCTP